MFVLLGEPGGGAPGRPGVRECPGDSGGEAHQQRGGRFRQVSGARESAAGEVQASARRFPHQQHRPASDSRVRPADLLLLTRLS